MLDNILDVAVRAMIKAATIFIHTIRSVVIKRDCGLDWYEREAGSGQASNGYRL